MAFPGIEFNGRESVPVAAETLLNNDGVDLVVIRGLITCLNTLDSLEAMDQEHIVPRLYDTVPELNEMDEIAKLYWMNHGYKDYLLKGRLEASRVTDGSTGIAHTDYSISEQAKLHMPTELHGPISISICTQGQGVYCAEKPKTVFMSDDRTFDISEWQDWKKLPAPTTLRSSVSQWEGDAVMIMNHPRQTFHSVQSPVDRKAAIFDYIVSRREKQNPIF